jgi:hypothetical protein
LAAVQILPDGACDWMYKISRFEVGFLIFDKWRTINILFLKISQEYLENITVLSHFGKLSAGSVIFVI